MQLSLKIVSLTLMQMLMIVESLDVQYNDQQIFNTCTTTKGTPGKCVNIKKCPKVLEMLQQKPLPPKTLEFLQTSKCGFEGSDPKICCDSEGEDPPPDVTLHRNLRLINQEECGQMSVDRVIGGATPGMNELPWMALLGYIIKNSKIEFRCGGSVINKRYILTAAHCVVGLRSDMQLIGVRVGEYDQSTEQDCRLVDYNTRICNEHQDFGIESISYHENYSRNLLRNDVALIRLDRPIDFTRPNAKPICLPVKSAEIIDIDGLIYMLVAGWGASGQELIRHGNDLKIENSYLPVIQSVVLLRYPQEHCAIVYKTEVDIWHKHICMGGDEGRDACVGDSGGPLMTSAFMNYGQARIVQYGIVSFGPKICAQQNVPGVYTRVDYYLDWILDHMRD